jgi:Na+-transporting NADH:ubiquinone oxidoreductase subunit NqrB
MPIRRAAWEDPRHLQIAALAALLIYGSLWLGFDVAPGWAVPLVATALLSQAAFGFLAEVGSFDPRSTLISSLSLCLLLRPASVPVAMLAAVLAIGSKFVLRVGRKHVFNPTNFAIVVTVFTTHAAWVSPGQWGAPAFLAFLLVCAGSLVVARAFRSDVTFAFLAVHAGIAFGRALWLGDPLAIPRHQLESGGLLLFAFFMISDPRTTPDSRAGRILFGALVAVLAGYFQFVLYRPVTLLPALFLLSPLVPLIDRALPGPRYDWPRPAQAHTSLPKGVVHAPSLSGPPVRAAFGTPRPALLRFLRRQGG